MSFSGQTQTKESLHFKDFANVSGHGNHYVIDRHGYPPYYFSSFGGKWMSGCMDKSMLILISL